MLNRLKRWWRHRKAPTAVSPIHAGEIVTFTDASKRTVARLHSTPDSWHGNAYGFAFALEDAQAGERVNVVGRGVIDVPADALPSDINLK